MKAREIFDVCFGRYRNLREWLRASNQPLRALNLEKPSAGYLWRPDRARACEYVADFERIGRNALRRPEWRGRLKLFEMYFLHNMEYRQAVRLVGVAEGTFDFWYQEVKRSLGAEFSRSGLFPPWLYFQREPPPEIVAPSAAEPAARGSCAEPAPSRSADAPAIPAASATAEIPAAENPARPAIATEPSPQPLHPMEISL